MNVHELGCIVYYIYKKEPSDWKVKVSKVVGFQEGPEGLKYYVKGCKDPLPENFLFLTPEEALKVKEQNDHFIYLQILEN